MIFFREVETAYFFRDYRRYKIKISPIQYWFFLKKVVPKMTTKATKASVIIITSILEN